MNAKLKEIFGVKIVSKSPRTDAVWERLATDTTGELEPDVEFSTLARQLEHELYESKEHIKRLEDWKQSALSVEREWDANLITTMLGGKLGEPHRKVIQREVPKLLVHIKRLEEAAEKMIEEPLRKHRRWILNEAKQEKP